MHLKLQLRLTLYSLFGKFVRKLLGPHAIAILVRTQEGVFAVDPEDNGVGGRLRRRGSYGEGEIERIRSLLTPQSRLLIVGAHIGTLAVPLSRSCASIVALEANPRTFALLKANLDLNGVTNCRILNLAAAEDNRTIEFMLSRDNSGGSKRKPPKKRYMFYYDRPQIISVPARRLDDLLEGESFDLIMMDIEGSECFAFRGMPRLLQDCRYLIAEFYPYNMQHVGGVGPEEYAGLLEPYFSSVFMPTRGVRVERARFRQELTGMYERNEVEDGLIFEKSSPA